MGKVGIGTTLYGYCGGLFGSASYQDKIVIAIGPDWLVAKNTMTNQYSLIQSEDDIESLEEYTSPSYQE